MNKIFLTAITVLTLTTSVFSQSVDSLSRTDYNLLKRWYAGNEVDKRKFKVAPFIAPAILIGYGVTAVYDKGALKELDISTRDELQEDHPLFAAHLDDYIQFAPAAAVYALNLSGVKGKHNLFDASMFYVTSAAVMGLTTHFIKRGVARERPDFSGFNSFPSGHTASAFTAAEFLHQEYKDTNPWIGYAGYFVATATGTLRMYNNKHWFSDVVAGAGVGIASTKIGYYVYPYIKSLFGARKTSNLVVLPVFSQGSTGLSLSAKL